MTESRKQADPLRWQILLWVELLLLPTEGAIRELRKGLKDANAVLHLTC
jgi:hypothetical protein